MGRVDGRRAECAQGPHHSSTRLRFRGMACGLCLAHDDKTVRIWDASTGAELNVLRGHTNLVNSVAISRDGMRIVSGSNDKSVLVWDLSVDDGWHVGPHHHLWWLRW
jgi:WD40 repeat protein